MFQSTDRSQQPLKTNPFTTYRDPQTGRWFVVKPEPAAVLELDSSPAHEPALTVLDGGMSREAKVRAIAPAIREA